MKEENINQIMNVVRDKIPAEKAMMLKNRLREVSDEKADAIMCTALHNPTHILLFSIFLGGLGVDRFMIGDIGLGVGKLLLGWLTCGLWPIIDIFISYKKAKEKNVNNLMLQL